MNKWTTRGFLLIAGSTVLGCECAPTPQATIGDPAVFTMLHVLAAEAGSDLDVGGQLNGPFTAAQMKRYFETKASDYADSRSHADELLDGHQSQSAFFQAIQTKAAIDLAATFAGGTPPGAGTGDTPASAAIAADAKAALAAALAAGPDDSPFDRLDRVADFYASYVVKNLRVRGDSRAINADLLIKTLEEVVNDAGGNNTLAKAEISDYSTKKNAYSTASVPAGTGRLLLLVFQADIVPNGEADVWTGVRLKVVGATNQVDKSLLNEVRILRVHPTHSYDVDSSSFGSDTSHIGSVSVTGGGKAGGTVDLSGSGSASVDAEQAERRNFLSHIRKTDGFIDAASHEFGYNFYPSNVKVDTLNPVAEFFHGGKYVPHAYLEGGARDCAVILMVPPDLKTLTFDVSSVWGCVDGGPVHDVTYGVPGVNPPVTTRPVVVSLPTWNQMELTAATFGAGPTVRAAAPAKVQPPVPTTQNSAPDHQPAK